MESRPIVAAAPQSPPQHPHDQPGQEHRRQQDDTDLEGDPLDARGADAGQVRADLGDLAAGCRAGLFLAGQRLDAAAVGGGDGVEAGQLVLVDPGLGLDAGRGDAGAQDAVPFLGGLQGHVPLEQQQQAEAGNREGEDDRGRTGSKKPEPERSLPHAGAASGTR